MEDINIKRIIINKNRGWRGLAELVCENEERENVHSLLFTFSNDTWKDLLNGYIVTRINDQFIILQFDNTEELKKLTQRSVLIKSFTATIINQYYYKTNEPIPTTNIKHFNLISNFISNKNIHTKSAWNNVGMRVTPYSI